MEEKKNQAMHKFNEEKEKAMAAFHAKKKELMEKLNAKKKVSRVCVVAKADPTLVWHENNNDLSNDYQRGPLR